MYALLGLGAEKEPAGVFSPVASALSHQVLQATAHATQEKAMRLFGLAWSSRRTGGARGR